MAKVKKTFIRVSTPLVVYLEVTLNGQQAIKIGIKTQINPICTVQSIR